MAVLAAAIVASQVGAHLLWLQSLQLPDNLHCTFATLQGQTKHSCSQHVGLCENIEK